MQIMGLQKRAKFESLRKIISKIQKSKKQMIKIEIFESKMGVFVPNIVHFRKKIRNSERFLIFWPHKRKIST